MSNGLSPAGLMHPVEQLLGLALHVEPGVLMRLGPRERGDALNEIEDRFRWAAFLGEDGLDDPAGFSLGESARPEEILPVFVAAGDNSLPRGLDAVDERLRRGIGKVQQRRFGFMGKAVRGIFAVANADLLEVLHPPSTPCSAGVRNCSFMARVPYGSG